MNRIHQVLIPTDFSPCAQNAFRYAQHLAADDDSFALVVVHVPRRPPNEAERAAIRQRFADMKASLPPRLQATSQFLVQEGELVSTLLSAQRAQQADLIVMGTYGSEEEEVQADSRTAHLVLEADCPVLVVPDEAQGFRLKQIAVALDQHDVDDESSLGVVHDVARWFGAKIHLLTIRSKTGATSAQDQKAEQLLEYYLETLDYRHAFPENTDIEQGITDYVREHDIDLLAMLPRNHAQKTKPSEGRLTKLLTLRTQIPLLAID
jgi:nucleotide-binding universal stress UspA family protein